ncbi:glycosyltransferase family 39 protein [Anaerobacillus sp. HL2]|nr:glycosyltransferase family 39 protein [Anaerobacillus sp. HL2]
MPESVALFFFIGAFYYFDKWIEDDRGKNIISATIFTALAIASKVPTIFVGIPMLVMAIIKYKKYIIKVWQLYLFALFSLCVPFFYFYWLNQITD